MAIYNMTNLTAANNIYEVARSTAEATNNQVVLVLYFATFYALFSIYEGKSDTIGTVTFSAFGVSMLGIILFTLGWVPIGYVAGPIALFSISFVARFVLTD